MRERGEIGFVIASPEAVSTELDAGLALLDLKSNQYYSLNRVGALIWNEIQERKSLEDVCAAVMSRFRVEPLRCRRDVSELLLRLGEAGLVRLEHAAPAAERPR